MTGIGSLIMAVYKAPAIHLEVLKAPSSFNTNATDRISIEHVLVTN